MLRARSIFLALTLLALSSSPALAANIDFEQYSNGEKGPFAIATPEANVTINPDGPPPGDHIGLAIFDSDTAGPNAAGADPDLIVDFGNILILQNNTLPTETIPGFFDTPNDDEDGGNFNIMFDAPVFMNSIDLIDINGGGMLTVSLMDSFNNSRVYDVPNEWTGDITVPGEPGFQTLDLTTLLPQLGVGPGGNATASQDLGFNANDVVNIKISFSGSAAIDNISFVPEPGTAVLVGLGLGTLGLRRRKA